MPSGEQQRQIRRFAGSCRFSSLIRRWRCKRIAFSAARKSWGTQDCARSSPGGAKTPSISDAPIHPLQQTLKDLERAYSNFFAKRAEFPRFKKKGLSDSFRYPDPKQIKLDQTNSRLFLPKLGWLRYRNSWSVLGVVKNVTLSQSGGRWFVSIQTEREVEQPTSEATAAVGIDMGVARFATLSDGTLYAPIHSFKRHETALRKAQQGMSCLSYTQ